MSVGKFKFKILPRVTEHTFSLPRYHSLQNAFRTDSDAFLEVPLELLSLENRKMVSDNTQYLVITQPHTHPALNNHPLDLDLDPKPPHTLPPSNKPPPDPTHTNPNSQMVLITIHNGRHRHAGKQGS